MMDTLTASPSGAPRDWSHVRHAEQVATDHRACATLLTFYLIDAALLSLFCAVGVGDWWSPLWFALTGAVVAGGSLLWVRRFGAGRLDQIGVVSVQSGAALLLTLYVALTDPPFVLLMLLTVIVIVPTTALRMAPRALLPLCVITAAAATGMLTAHGGQLTIPSSTPMQQLLSALFLFWTLGKAAFVNVIGMTLRLELAESHERLSAALERVEQLAQRDELTGLVNRRRVLAALAEEHRRFHAGGPLFSVAMLDVDHFKRVNDRHGHPVGDAVLRAVAQLLRQTLRERDIIGRWGGEEFLMVLPGTASMEQAQHTAERVRSAIEHHDWAAAGTDLQITASIGVTMSDGGDTVDSVVHRADQCLYGAKAAGRNQVGPALTTPAT